MPTDTPTETPILPRIHLALAVADLEASLRFYRALLGVEPEKQKPGYAKLVSDAPSINLALNESTQLTEIRMPMHFGVEVGDVAEVERANARMREAGFLTEDERGVTCCFAVQDKVWVEDPDGHRWEVYVRLSDAEVHSLPQPGAESSQPSTTEACCEGATKQAATPCCEPAAPSTREPCCG